MQRRQPEVALCHRLAANLPGSSHLLPVPAVLLFPMAFYCRMHPDLNQPEVAPCHKLAANLPGSSHLHQTNSEVLPLGSCSDLLNLAGLLQETNQCYFQIKSNNQKIKIKQNKTKKSKKTKQKN